MKTYEIWAEGYKATCGSGRATFLGTIEADNFDNAVIDWALDYAQPELIKQHASGEWTYWRCKLFDNELDARASFG